MTIQKKKKIAQDIMSKFIRVGSMFEINLDNKMRENTIEIFEVGNIAGILEAQEYIVDLLRQDAYPRFSRSTELKNWVQYRQTVQQKMGPT